MKNNPLLVAASVLAGLLLVIVLALGVATSPSSLETRPGPVREVPAGTVVDPDTRAELRVLAKDAHSASTRVSMLVASGADASAIAAAEDACKDAHDAYQASAKTHTVTELRQADLPRTLPAERCLAATA